MVRTGARIVALAGLLSSVACVALLHVVRADLAPRTHRLSEYANGPHGWLMTAAFVALGCGLIALGVALRSDRGSKGLAGRAVPVAAFSAGVGAIVSAAFKTGVSQFGEAVHSRASALATVALVALALFYSLGGARRGDGARLGIVLSLLVGVLAALSSVLHETSWTGLSQRLLWIALLGWLLWVARHRPPRWDDEVPAS
jgi:hypothetical protein